MSSSAPTTLSRTSLVDVERVVGEWCDGTDPAVHSGADAAIAAERLARLMRRLAAKQAGFASRVDACRSHPRQLAGPDEYLARLNGTTVGEAKQVIDTARRLQQCPATAEAFERGELSVGEAHLISGAAVLDPAAEAALVAKATSSHDLAGLRERTDRVKAAARHGEDPATRRARLRARRRWNEFDDDEMKAVAARFLPDEWARVAPVVDAYATAMFERARKAGITDPTDAYRADAVLAALAAAGDALGLDLAARPATPDHASHATQTAATPAGSTMALPTAPSTVESSEPELEVEDLLQVRPGKIKWNVTVLVDAIALKRGYATAGETCEIPGIGPVDVAWICQILPEALVDVLVHDLHDIKAYATMSRHRRRAINVTLQARDQRCVVPGCKRRRRLEADHRRDHAKGGPTSQHNLGLLCEKHHDEKTYRGARIDRTATEWLWYPPPPKPGEPEPPPGSIPWRAPIGEHLTAFDLTDLPEPHHPDDTLPSAS